ncbi:MAG TPA: hypothetical protein VLO29_10800 [Salegentibacter sp.]|nr:hypothetical protein [Salegentibacter sp.]
MAEIVISNKLLTKYFNLLKAFDVRSRKILIKKLKDSLKDRHSKIPEEELFGAWKDERSSEEIIKEIHSSRVEKKLTSKF